MPLRVPKHWAVKEWLLEFVEHNPPGTAVPPERQLAEHFRLSRTSVRRAVQEVVVEGRLLRLQGKGTFVAPSKVAHRLRLSSYTEEIQAHGMAATSRTLAVDVLPAPATVADRLGLVAGAEVLRIERLRLADLEPMALDVNWFSADRFPDLAGRLAAADSIYAALDDHYGVRPATAEQTIETVMASPEEAALLRTEIGLPLLLLTRHAFLDGGEPVEFARSVFRGDRYRFVATLTRG